MHTRDCVYQMKSAHIRTEVVTDGDSLLEFVFVIEDMRERERDVRRTFRFRIHVAKHCEATIEYNRKKVRRVVRCDLARRWCTCFS